MTKYIIQRILLIIPMMLVVTFIVFSLVSLSPINPGRMKLGAEASEEAVAQVNADLGFDKPFIVRYFNFVSGAVRGQFGDSWYFNRPVFDDIAARWPNTIKLTLLSISIAIVIGIPLGVLAAVKQYSWMDRTFTTFSMFLSSIPTFAIATLAVLLFSYKLKWVPVGFKEDAGIITWILPAMTLGISYSAMFLRYTRSVMLDTIRQDYVRTVRSKGAPERQVIWGHAFRNALLPLITITGMTLGGLLGGAVVMESVFVIPGLGSLVMNGINQFDMPMVMGAITVLAFTFMIIMLIVDLLYAVVDPRIRARYGGGNSIKKKNKKIEGAVQA